MSIRITLFSLLSMFILLPNVFAGKIEINLKNKVVLEDEIITVNDISTVTGDDADLVNKIKGIEIGHAPGANNERRIDISFIGMRLNASNVNVTDVSFTDTKSVLVSVKSTKIKGLEIAQKAKEYLLDFLPMDGRETTVEIGRVPADQWVPRRRDKIDFYITLVDTSKDRGRIELIVSASSNGKLFLKYRFILTSGYLNLSLLQRRKHAANNQLTEENVFIARRETTRIRGMAFSSINDLKGMTTTTSVQPHTILTDYMVETPPTMKQGSIVKLIVKKSGFKIVTKGLAQQTGYKGEVIKVKNLDSKKMLYGKIINSDSVQVIF